MYRTTKHSTARIEGSACFRVESVCMACVYGADVAHVTLRQPQFDQNMPGQTHRSSAVRVSTDLFVSDTAPVWLLHCTVKVNGRHDLPDCTWGNWVLAWKWEKIGNISTIRIKERKQQKTILKLVITVQPMKCWFFLFHYYIFVTWV